MLYEIDVSTGGPLGIDVGTTSLAWDCTTQTMYGADGSLDRVFEIDLATGAATKVQYTSVSFGSVGRRRAAGQAEGVRCHVRDRQQV